MRAENVRVVAITDHSCSMQSYAGERVGRMEDRGIGLFRAHLLADHPSIHHCVQARSGDLPRLLRHSAVGDDHDCVPGTANCIECGCGLTVNSGVITATAVEKMSDVRSHSTACSVSGEHGVSNLRARCITRVVHAGDPLRVLVWEVLRGKEVQYARPNMRSRSMRVLSRSNISNDIES